MSHASASTNITNDAGGRAALPSASLVFVRILLSALVSVLGIGLLLALAMLPPVVTEASEWQGVVFIAAVAMLVAGCHAFPLGVPFAFVLWRTQRMRWWTVLPGGFAIGYLPFFCLEVLPNILDRIGPTGDHDGLNGPSLLVYLQQPLLFAGFGMLGALLFLIAFRVLSRGR